MKTILLMRPLAWVWVGLVALALSLLLATRSRTLDGADECREAGMAREMADGGDVVVPRLNGQPFLEKPPLFYAVAAGFVRLLGPSELAVRLAPGLFAAVAVAAVFARGRHLTGCPRGAAFAALVLASTPAVVNAAHHCVTNIAVAATTSIALIAFERLVAGDRPHAAAAVFYAALGAGFLAKNLFGVAVPAAAALAYVVFARDGRALRRLVLTPGILVFAATVLPWIWLLYEAGERGPPAGQGLAFLRTALVDNTVGRFAGDYGGHNSGAKNVPGWLLGAFGPWTLLVAFGFAGELRRAFADADPGRRRRARVLVAWTVAPLLLLTMSASKRPQYMVALVAPWCVAVGAWWEDLALRGGTERELALAGLGAAAAAVGGPNVFAFQDWRWRAAPGLPAIAMIAAGALLLVLALRLARRGDLGRLALVAVIGGIGYAATPLDGPVVRAQDEAGEGPFHTEVARLVPAGEIGVVGYGERELGSAYFYLGRTVTDLGNWPPEELGEDEELAQDLAAFMERPGVAAVLVQRQRRGEPAPSIADAIASSFGTDPPPLIVRHARVSGRRRLVLVAPRRP
jgi:4-amino-4-deoxy-L-arabinose transferase-like glycosyltransferase